MKPLHQYAAEYTGTFFMVFFGCGSIILTQTAQASANTPLVFGATISVMIHALGHISGAHFNPAVTIAFFCGKKFPLGKVPGYLIAQCLGGLCASLLHALIFGSQHNFGATHINTTLGLGFLLETLISFFLMLVIISVATDSRAAGEFAGIAIGATVSVCACVIGPLTGASMNFARSLGPALFNNNLDHLGVYALAPVMGTTLAALFYQKIKGPE